MKPIPKSLHTVTVLVTMAKLIRAQRPLYTYEDAVSWAFCELGYAIEQDHYDLCGQAVKKLMKGQ